MPLVGESSYEARALRALEELVDASERHDDGAMAYHLQRAVAAIKALRKERACRPEFSDSERPPSRVEYDEDEQ